MSNFRRHLESANKIHVLLENVLYYNYFSEKCLEHNLGLFNTSNSFVKLYSVQLHNVSKFFATLLFGMLINMPRRRH